VHEISKVVAAMIDLRAREMGIRREVLDRLHEAAVWRMGLKSVDRPLPAVGVCHDLTVFRIRLPESQQRGED
jgi:hypothetical protein